MYNRLDEVWCLNILYRLIPAIFGNIDWQILAQLKKYVEKFDIAQQLIGRNLDINFLQDGNVGKKNDW